jgi:hypothetical protein
LKTETNIEHKLGKLAQKASASECERLGNSRLVCTLAAQKGGLLDFETMFRDRSQGRLACESASQEARAERAEGAGRWSGTGDFTDNEALVPATQPPVRLLTREGSARLRPSAVARVARKHGAPPPLVSRARKTRPRPARSETCAPRKIQGRRANKRAKVLTHASLSGNIFAADRPIIDHRLRNPNPLVR